MLYCIKKNLITILDKPQNMCFILKVNELLQKILFYSIILLSKLNYSVKIKLTTITIVRVIRET